jgi:5-hydroxyisourate hydrolase
MGRVTTHVLDTATGRPARGLRIVLRDGGPDGALLADVKTNSDGRVDGPILDDAHFKPGVYELTFHAGDYLRAQGIDLPQPAFLDEIPIRFGLSEDAHYHVPLLLSPYGYSTYRGS